MTSNNFMRNAFLPVCTGYIASIVLRYVGADNSAISRDDYRR